MVNANTFENVAFSLSIENELTFQSARIFVWFRGGLYSPFVHFATVISETKWFTLERKRVHIRQKSFESEGLL